MFTIYLGTWQLKTLVVPFEGPLGPT